MAVAGARLVAVPGVAPAVVPGVGPAHEAGDVARSAGVEVMLWRGPWYALGGLNVSSAAGLLGRLIAPALSAAYTLIASALSSAFGSSPLKLGVLGGCPASRGFAGGWDGSRSDGRGPGLGGLVGAMACWGCCLRYLVRGGWIACA